MSSEPELSVVLVAPDRFASVRRAVRHLREQTARERIELVVAAPTEDALADRRDDELQGFARMRVVECGAVDDIDRAAAHALRAASAPLVALLEDHAFPAADWAERVLEAAAGGEWAAIGSAFENANPARALSWANFLLSYGSWSEPPEGGETGDVSRHNVTLSAEALRPLAERLPSLVGRSGSLHDALRAAGGRFVLVPEARIAHVNPSRLSSSARLRFDAGRLYGARRAADGGWSPLRRALYVAGAPLIAPLRFARVRRSLLSGGRHASLGPRVHAALALCLVFDAAGQALGYAGGEGGAADRLARFEHDRLRHVTVPERARLAE